MISVLYTRVELMLASRMLSTPLVCEDLMRLVDDLQGRIDTLKNDNEKLRRQLSQILHALSSERPKVNYINIYGGQNQILPDARWAEQTGDGMG